MNARKPAPIGPLAIIMRHLQSSGRRVTAMGVVLGMALLIGIAWLLVR